MGGDQANPEITQLVLDHHREIFAYAYRLCGSVADAEDLTQTVFVTAHQKLDQLRSPETARAWLYAILRSHFLKLCRKRRPSPAASLDMDLDDMAGPIEETPEIDRERLQNALNALPENHRLILLMFYFEECSYREIAERLETPMGTVMSRLARAKARLRSELVPGGQEESAHARSANERR